MRSFDCVTIGFGLRNVTDKARALASMRRVLKPGGQLLVLEFSKPTTPSLQALYDAYSFKLLPCSAVSSPATPTVTGISPNRSAAIRTRKRYLPCCATRVWRNAVITI
jgi:SAM-dependent methyltransferase